MQEYQLNSFQKWARDQFKAADIGFIFTGNWVNVDGEPVMTYYEVLRVCRDKSA